MKKVLIFIISAIMTFVAVPVYATDSIDNITVEYLEDGSSYVTIIGNTYSSTGYEVNSTTKTPLIPHRLHLGSGTSKSH